MNKSDSERIATILENQGYSLASKMEEADLIMVNMCSVRQSAVDRVYGLIPKFQKLKNQNSKIKTILTGCILEEDKKKFNKKFDLILDIKDLPNLPNRLQYHRLVYGTKNSGGKKKVKNYFHIEPKYRFSESAFVPIMTGCNNFCAYCVVPYTRGREISRPVEEIICEVKNLVKKGYKEIILLGQNVNSYNNEQRTKNNEEKINFAKLLKMINEIPGNFKIRFLTSHPKDMSDELIETIAKCQKVVKEIHLPVQSGDDTILKKMNRGYTISHYKNLIKKIHQKIPGVKISTDVIVGFPGETKEQFENTVKLFKEIKFDKAYIARYSPRPGTAAAKLKDDVPLPEKKRREKILEKILNSPIVL